MQPPDARPGITGAGTSAPGSAHASSGSPSHPASTQPDTTGLPKRTAADAPPVPGAGGVVFDQAGRVLLLRQMNGNWVFPKGHVEPGETPLQAALREVKEETGVHTMCPQPHRTWHTSYRNSKGVPRRITWFALQAEGALNLAPEPGFAEVQFFEPGHALRQLAFVQDRELLEAVLEEVPTGGSAPGNPTAPQQGQGQP